MNDDRDGDSGQVPQLANRNAEPAELDISASTSGWKIEGSTKPAGVQSLPGGRWS